MPIPSCQTILMRSPLSASKDIQIAGMRIAPQGLLHLQAPARSYLSSCRCGRPPATPARPRELGSWPQRPYYRRGQAGRRRRWNAQASRAAKLDLDRFASTWRNALPAIRIRRHDHCRKTGAGAAQLLAPAINLPGANVSSTRHLRNDRPRRKCRRNQRPLLLLAPASPPLRAADQLKSRHRTVSCISASTGCRCYPARSIRRSQGGLPRRETPSAYRQPGNLGEPDQARIGERHRQISVAVHEPGNSAGFVAQVKADLLGFDHDQLHTRRVEA